VGYKNKLFTMYKLRSMTNERDAEGNLLPDEVRLKKWGKIIRKTNMDELFQIWNILKGEMSFIGPRPILPEEMKGDVRSTLISKASEKNINITFAGNKDSFNSARFTMDGMMEFTYDGITYKTALNGRHQIGNAVTSIEACRKCGIPEDAIKEGIALARWKSRAEILSIEPTIIIDGGHNPQGAQSLGETMNEMLGGSLRGKPVRLLMGVMADKDVSGILEAYKACGLNIRSAVTVMPDNPRSEPADVLAQKINYVYNISDDLTACKNALEGTKLAYVHDLPEKSALGMYRYVIELEREKGFSDEEISRLKGIDALEYLGRYSRIEG
jgi:UDP-N-acetylmuramyl tripeptide synthase